MVGFLHGDGGALRLLFSGLDEVARCLVVKYLLTETPMTKYDIARALGWGKNTQYVDRILRRCQDNNNANSTVTPEITMTVKEIEEAIRGCVAGNCGRVRAIIRMAKLRDVETNTNISPLMLIIGGYVVSVLRNYFSRSKIYRMAVRWHALKRLMRFNEVLEFSRVSGFRLRSVFDAYWMYTSLVTLKLPLIIKSRFDSINEDVCDAFSDEKLCHMYIAGYLIAEAKKSAKDPYRRFKQVNTSHPASVVTMLSIANHFAKHGIMTKAYIREKYRKVFFVLSDLPKDLEHFIEDVWGDPAVFMGLADEEFMAFLSGLMAGDGTVVWGRSGVEVALSGNLESEKSLYAIIQSELKRRLGIEASLFENNNRNAIVLRTWGYDAVRLLRMLPPLIEPLKELRRQVLLNKGRLGAYLAGELFRLLGDGKRSGKKGIHGLQSYQAIRFLTVLLRLGLIRLKEVEGRKYRILEIPINPRGWLKSAKTTPRAGIRTQVLWLALFMKMMTIMAV